MKSMYTRILLALSLVSAAFAQRPVQLFPPELRAFLSLSDAQVQAISRTNSDYAEYSVQKSIRMAQVQREIDDETRKDVLDPGALGVRYAELEAIRRDLDDQLQRTREKIAAQLTDPQKARLKTLDDARKLQPVIRDAECANLLAPLPPVLVGVISPNPFPANIIPLPIGSSRAGCLTFSPGGPVFQP
jgi:hypothetical protein